jgi:uncharacterized protein (TIGR02757 family)
MSLTSYAQDLESLYHRYNRRGYVHPDPLELVLLYDDPADQEVVALIASTLAYGRVSQILRSVALALQPMGLHPSRYLRGATVDRIRRDYLGFYHRFSTGEQLAALLAGVKRVMRLYGSLREFFVSALFESDPNILPALESFVSGLAVAAGEPVGHLLPCPAKGSACKRMNLFLRWMVRRDQVDPGGWDEVPAAKLLIPLDTHMHRICLVLGATRRRAADMRAAVEVTEAFRKIAPEDPVKYDFVLTRLAIRPDVCPAGAFCQPEEVTGHVAVPG